MKKLPILVLASLCITTQSGAEPPESKNKLDKALERYERTGEMKQCINPRRIRSSNVVDDNHIIFQVSNKVAYLNTLPRKCHSLGFHEAISYTVRGSVICSNEFFTVFTNTMMPGPSCSFGKFEKIEKKAKS